MAAPSRAMLESLELVKKAKRVVRPTQSYSFRVPIDLLEKVQKEVFLEYKTVTDVLLEGMLDYLKRRAIKSGRILIRSEFDE